MIGEYQLYRVKTFFKNYIKYKNIVKKYNIKFSHWYKHYEFIENPEMYLKYIPKLNETIVDIGSQYGDYDILWNKLFNSNVISIEALEKNYKELIKDIKLNNSNITALNYIVGDGNIIISNVKGNMLNKADIGNLYTSKKLDEILNVNKIDILKIDVEGFEYEVLVGSINTINKFKPRIIIETHNEKLFDKCFDFLTKINYKLDFANKNFNRIGIETEHINCFYKSVI